MVTLVFIFSWNMEAFSVVNLKPSGQLQLLHSAQWHTPWIWRRRGMLGGQEEMGSCCSPCILMALEIHPVMAVYSVVGFFPPNPLCGCQWLEVPTAVLCCVSCPQIAQRRKHLQDWTLPSGLHRCQGHCSTLEPIYESICFTKVQAAEGKPTNGRKGVGCVLMNNKTAFLLFFLLSEVYCCLQLLASKVLPNDNGKETGKIMSNVCATHHCCFVCFYVCFLQVTVGLKLLK